MFWDRWSSGKVCVAEVNWKMGILAREVDRGTVYVHNMCRVGWETFV